MSVDIEDGARNFGDAEETAKTIMKREKLKKAGNARKVFLDNPRSDKNSPGYRRGFNSNSQNFTTEPESQMMLF